MDIRGTAGRHPVALIVLALTGLVASPVVVGAQELEDAKPDLALPDVSIDQIDEALLGVGDPEDARSVASDPIPLAVPEIGSPVDVHVGDDATRMRYDEVYAPEIPDELAVRGSLRGGGYGTFAAGFDVTQQLATGGLFGRLGGEASSGHLTDSGWSRLDLAVGAAMAPTGGSALRVEIGRRSRETDLPVSGERTAVLTDAHRQQTFDRWSGEAAYRIEGGGFVLGLTGQADRGSFRAMTGARDQAVLDARAGVHLDVPLGARMWNASLDAKTGVLDEEDPMGSSETRGRLDAEATVRMRHDSGWSVIAGLALHRLGSANVAGPKLRLAREVYPAGRLWLGVAPVFVAPDVLDHLEDTPFAAGLVGQAPERSILGLEAGGELWPNGELSLDGRVSLRRSRGYLHLEASDPGRYALANLGLRYVLEAAGRASWQLPRGFVVESNYALTWIEGARIAYVATHVADVGLRYRMARGTAGVTATYLGDRFGSTGEGRLSGGWTLGTIAEVRVGAPWEVTFEGRNLLDRGYRDYGEYLAEGRSLHAGFRYAF